MGTPLRIDIVSDTVCPWCYVGKRHLESALAQRPELSVECYWQPFQLNPDMPMEGVDRKTHWRNKFGDDAKIKQMTERLVEIGTTMGLPFDFDAISRQPNTLKSHALLHWVEGDWERQNRLKEDILSAFFMEGLDIGDDGVLTKLATQCGLDEAEVSRVLADEPLLNQVRQLDQAARQMGVSGVPTFIFDRKSALVGAQPTEQLLQAIDQVAAERS